jgi:SAM-dependent methyltransferase
MNYQPREFWDRRLSEQFDLRGTGETGLSLAYNRACYALRQRVLTRALEEAGMDPRSRAVLDVGCGTGFFTAYYLGRGSKVTGLDIAPTSIERLRQRHPEARFLLADVGETTIEGGFDVVNAFDVLYHITDDARWERALRNLARAVAPSGVLLVTDTFADWSGPAVHNRMRPLSRYREVLESEGLTIRAPYPTSVLLNRELGAFRFLNRAPGLLLLADRALLRLGRGHSASVSKLLVAQRSAEG